MRRQPGLVLTEAEIFLIPVTCVTCVSQGRGRKRGRDLGSNGTAPEDGATGQNRRHACPEDKHLVFSDQVEGRASLGQPSSSC